MTRHRRRPRVVNPGLAYDPVLVWEASPATEALGDLDRINLHRNYRPTPRQPDPSPEENPMPDNSPFNPLDKMPVMMSDLKALATEFNNNLDAVVSTMTEAMDATAAKLREEFTSALAHAVADVEALVATTGRGGPDNGDRIVRFLESHPGVKFSPTSVAENLGLDRADQLCKRLASTGRISVDIKPGRRPLYFVKG
jgi:hypothetical protein